MRKFGECPLCGRTAMSTNMRKIVRQNQLYGFYMALDGIRSTWGVLIHNMTVELGLTDEQEQKLIRIGDEYWRLVGEYRDMDLTPDDFAEYIVAKSEEAEKNLRNRWGG